MTAISMESDETMESSWSSESGTADSSTSDFSTVDFFALDFFLPGRPRLDEANPHSWNRVGTEAAPKLKYFSARARELTKGASYMGGRPDACPQPR